MFTKSFLLISVSLFTKSLLFAQPGINSIYSAYGIGDVNLRDANSYASMGGVGVAISSDKLLNTNNPASYSSISRGTYLMELSFSGKNIGYKNGTQTFTANDFVINGAALGFSISKRIGGAVSLKRYSTVEYYTLANRDVDGTSSKLIDEITGSGGLYFASAGIGVKLNTHLSLGLSGGSIFGSVNKKENIYTSATDGFIIETNSFYNNFFGNAGLQYKFKKAGLNWTIGTVLQPSVQLRRSDDYYIRDFANNILYKDSARDEKFKYPLQWEVGIAAGKNHSLVSIDYIRQTWGNTLYKGNSFNTTDLQNMAIGFKHTYQRNVYDRKTDGMSLMLGAQRELSYIIINNYRVQSFCFTAGLNLPSKNNLYNYTFGIKYGQRGKVQYPLVKENFIEFDMNVSLRNFLNIGGAKFF